jgi:hypothetical protein
VSDTGRIANPAGVHPHLDALGLHFSPVTRVGIVQEKRASAPLSPRPAAVALFALTGDAVSDNISALAMEAVQDLDHHDVTRLAWGCSDGHTL